VGRVRPLPRLCGGGARRWRALPPDYREERKDRFTVRARRRRREEIEVIKGSPRHHGIGLKEARNLVEGAPKPGQRRRHKDEAEKVKAQPRRRAPSELK